MNEKGDLCVYKCLTDIATSLGSGFLPFTEPVFTRCVMLISTTLQNTIQQDDYEEFDDLEDEFIVIPLDLLSGIVQGLGEKVEPFVQQSTILPLLAVCAHYVSYHSTGFCLILKHFYIGLAV